jgi:hypothetical protein
VPNPVNTTGGPTPPILNSGSVSLYDGVYDVSVVMLQIHARRQQIGILFELMA